MRRRRVGLALAAAALLALAAPASALGFGFITSWGTGGSGDGQFGEASDVAVDEAFDVYVTDRFNDRVQVFSPLGAFQRKWSAPESFGLDVVGGSVFVTEFNGDGISRFSTQGAFQTRWGSLGTPADSGQPRYREPWGIDVGPDGKVYAVDSVNGRVVVTTQSGEFLGQMGLGMLSGPFGVAVDPSGGGSVYVADTGNNRIVRLDPGGTFNIIGGPGTGNVQFDFPMDVAFDPNGDLLVADRDNNRIQRITRGGTFISKFGSVGGAPGQLGGPSGVAADAAGNVYVAESGNQRVSRFGDRADLAATMTPSRTALVAGEDVAFTARVANAGPDRAQLTSARFAVPAGTAVVSATSTQGSCAGPVCAVGTLPPGGAAAVTLTLRAQAAGTFAVGLTATSPTFDADPTNNSAQNTITAQAGAVAAAPGLGIASARFRARWARSRVKGALVVRLGTPRAARVFVELLPGFSAKRVADRWRLRLPRAGQFTRSLPLEATTLPGAYRIRVREAGVPAARALAPGVLGARLLPPPEGVVSRAFISRGVGGKGVRRITGRLPGFLFANFRIAAGPKKRSRLRVDWFWSGGRGAVATKRVRPVAGLAVSPLRNARGSLPAGRYRAVLRYGRTVVAVASVKLG